MEKSLKKSKTLILPALKEKKRFVVLKSNSKSIETIKTKISNFFGVDNLAKSGLMHLKEFDTFKNKNYYFVFKINPKFLSLLARAIIFIDFKSHLIIKMIFGNVRKLKLFLKNDDVIKDDLQLNKDKQLKDNLILNQNKQSKDNIVLNKDLVVIENEGDLIKLDKNFDVRNFYDINKVAFALPLKLVQDAKIMTFVKKSPFEFILMACSYDELKSFKKILDKGNYSYILNFDKYDELDLIKLYKSLKIKPLGIFNLEKNKKSDFLRFRNSNFNQVIAKFFGEKKLLYGVNLSSLKEKNHQSIHLGRLYQNLKLVKKYNVPLAFYSLDTFSNYKLKSNLNIKLAFKDFQIDKLIFDIF